MPGAGGRRHLRIPPRRETRECGKLHPPFGKLETLTGSYPGVEKAYAIQAGREVRIIVKPEEVSEDNMILLARDLAKKIESELEYPGQIKVNVIRETKAVEYAK